MALLAGALLLGTVGASATHGEWLDHYTSASGQSCCGKSDCAKNLPVRIVEFQEYATIVEIGETRIAMPPKSVHQSEDGDAHVCIVGWDRASALSARVVRCVFYVIGS